MELKKKTYITTMPNQIGAFLQASRCFAQLGVNLTRVSYNKAVDSHMLFIDAEGTEEQLHQADTLLRGIGYLPQTETAPQIILIAFYLRDVPGAVVCRGSRTDRGVSPAGTGDLPGADCRL